MKIKYWLIAIFHFNKQERNGVFVLFTIILLLVLIKLFLPIIIVGGNAIQLVQSSSLAQDTNVLMAHDAPTLDKNSRNENASNQKFVFNPNTLSLQEALQLGFSKKLYATLTNYKSKGGHFYKPEDFKKVYGLSPKLYKELAPYILIPNTKKKEIAKQNDAQTFIPKTSYSKKENTKPLLDINLADSLALVYLKGIGPAFTKRILKYRTLLGGFHSVNQLKDIYGITDTLFISLSTQITVSKNNFKKIPINAIDVLTLRKHPYFNFHSASALINYRTKHGLLTQKDIETIGLFDAEKLDLILPYLVYD